MELNVEVEKPSSILRKLTIRVPAKEVKTHLDRGLVSVQKTANLKGFRPGHAPLSVIKQFYGEDVRHRVFHNLIDESFDLAVRQNNLKAVGSPQIDTSHHQTGTGAHDHSIQDNQDLVFTATIEVVPEIQVQDYTGISVSQEKVNVTDEMVEKVVENLQNSQAQLVPVEGGLANADGTASSRPVQKNDFADIKFAGGLVTETGIQEREDMKGSRLIEIGSNAMIPGFEDEIIGMRTGETKTFRISFPSDYGGEGGSPEATALAGKEAEFTVTVQELKEKKLPALDEEFVKQMGYENLEDLRIKAKEYLVRERTDESQSKVRSELVSKLIEKNPFEVPASLIESQTTALAQDWAQELKKQGYPEKLVQQTVQAELAQIRSRAESQVRASLILETIAHQENIKVSPEETDQELDKLSVSMKIEKAKLLEFYAKNPGRKGDLEFRLRQERTLKFLLDKAKIKSVEANEK